MVIERVILPAVAVMMSIAATARVHDGYVAGGRVGAGHTLVRRLDMQGDGRWEVSFALTPEGNREGRETRARISLVRAADSLDVTLRWYNERFGDFDDRRLFEVEARLCGDAAVRRVMQPAAGAHDEPMSIWINATSAGIDLYAGVFYREYIGRIEDTRFRPDAVSVTCSRPCEVSRIYMADERSARPSLQTSLTVDSIMSRCRASSDINEGIWRYLDRENDPRKARLGGNYTVATLRNGDGYDIVYMSGAEIWPDRWQPGMLKGHLSRTIFSGIYDLMWYDAGCEPLGNPYSTVCDNHAEFDTGNSVPAIMTLNFPLLKARLRFSRVPLR